MLYNELLPSLKKSYSWNIQNKNIRSMMDRDKVGEIIDTLLYCLKIEGDDGFSEFTDEEKEQMREFLLTQKVNNCKRV